MHLSTTHVAVQSIDIGPHRDTLVHLNIASYLVGTSADVYFRIKHTLSRAN